MRHKHGVAALSHRSSTHICQALPLSLLLRGVSRRSSTTIHIVRYYVPVQHRAAARRAGHEGGGLRLEEAKAMRSAARAAFHADHEPLHAVVSQEVAPTS